MLDPVKLQTDGWYDETSLHLALRLPYAAIDRARRSGELRSTTRGGRTLFLGAWIHAWLLGTGAGIIFKGSGFYSTDYRSSSYKEGAKKETPGSDKPKTEAKGEGAPKPGKPEKKSE